MTEEPVSEALRGAIEAGFRGRLGGGVKIDVERVAAIAAEASGKFRYVQSRVAPTSRPV